MAQSLSPSPEPAQPPSEPKAGRKKINPRLLVPIVLLILGGSLATWYFWWLPRQHTSAGELPLSGRIEGYETDVGAKVAGRVSSIAVREGDRVNKGQVIAQLDDAEVQAQLRGAQAQIENAQEKARQARLQIDVVESQIREAQLNLQQSQGDAQGQIYQAQANVAAVEAQLAQARAQLNQANADLKLARVNRDRFAQLVKEGAVTRQQFDQAQTTFETALATLHDREAAVQAVRKQVSAAQGGLVQAQTSALNPNIRNAQLNALQKQLVQARSQLEAAQAEVANAQAARQEIQAQIAYLKIVSPINGVVTARSVEPGAVVTTGKTLLTLVNLNNVYLRGYIPEGDIGKIRVGQPANVFLDSAPDQALSAHVAAIDPQASFTPENVYFRDDRVKQVFGVKLILDHPGGFAKPGMPADGEIMTEAAPQAAVDRQRPGFNLWRRFNPQ